MIEAVFVFGLLNVAFESVLLSMLAPRTRLRVLGSERMSGMLHLLFLLSNLAIHWGTLTGSMASILAFICSLLTVKALKSVYGSVSPDLIYRPGLLKYTFEELR